MKQTKLKISIVSCLFLFLVLSGNILKAQLAVTPGGTAQQLAELISGQGVQILNPVINCPTNGYGTYNASVVNFNSEEGLILATGKITNAIGPNNTESKTTDFNAPGNALLTAVSGFTTYDGCQFEFDIIPQGDSLKFDFTFASEEYQEYVGTPFNDVFGFFISGPGIVGDPGLGDNKNIAVIPGTSTPVTVNKINNGNPNLVPPYPPVNPEYFVPNPLNANAPIQYDGWTKGLYAEIANLEACDTYHLILSIADASDEFWDAAVFIEKIQSNGVFVTTSTEAGIDNMIEGCNNGTITFTRTNVTNQPKLVTYYLAGTALNSIDYPLIGNNPSVLVPKFALIPAGQASKSVQVFPTDDNIAEGLEYITIILGNPFCEGAKSDSTDFFIQDSLTVVVNPAITQICPGTSILFDVEGDGQVFSWSPPTYLDNPNIKEPVATPTSAITYVVTNTLTTQFGACIATDTAVVAISDLAATGVVTNINCSGNNTGAIDITVSGGQGPYLYAWTGPNGSLPSTQDQNNLIEGNYSVSVTDNLGCRITLNFQITVKPPLTAVISASLYIGGKNVSCNGASDGSISVVVSGGTLPYSYLWNTTPVQTGSTATGLAAGSYTVTITDANGCTLVKNKTLTQPLPLLASISGQVNINCSGQSNGSATVVASGGTAPYTYLWNTIPAQTTATANNLNAGTFTVIVKDVNNCTSSATVTIVSTNTPLVVTTIKTNVSCNGFANGTATATVTGGANPISYSWNTAPIQNTQTATGLSPGTYIVTVTDANGCQGSAPVIINQPNALAISITSQTNITCGNIASGSATVLASGGVGPYSYSWNTTPVIIGNSIVGVSAGSYIVTATDARGCTKQLTITILNIPSTLAATITSTTNVNCFGTNTGSATVQATGGTLPYSYSWNTTPVQTGTTATNLSAGSYNVTITDGAGCVFILPVSITQPTAALQANITNVQNILCFGQSTGSATVVASNGTPPYTYLWNDALNQTTATASNLPAGSYSVIVTDSKGCVKSVNVVIVQPASALSAVVSNIDNTDCGSTANGSATVLASGGSGSYNYLWNTSPEQTTATANGLAPGIYTVTVSDNNGCASPIVLNVTIIQVTNSLNVIITSPEVFGSVYNIGCFGDSTATINTSVSGGTAPYIYNWTLPDLSNANTPNLLNGTVGVYQLTVLDSNGCTFFGNISIIEPTAIEISASAIPAPCFGANTGSIDVTITGGIPNYNYNWDGPGAFTSTNEDISNLFGGNYLLSVTDSAGCPASKLITVVQTSNISILIDSVSSYFNGFNISCNGASDGYIEVSTTGGNGAIDFYWNGPNFPNYATGNIVDQIPAGIWEVVATDTSGCNQNLFVTITEPTPIDIDYTVQPNSCSSQNNGIITTAITGGIPAYTFQWTGPAGFTSTDQNINNLFTGIYSLTVTDSILCTKTIQIEIIDLPEIELTLTGSSNGNGGNINCFGANNGTIDLNISGGNSPYSISWTGPNGFISFDEDISNLIAGEYCATVTDTSGCSKSSCLTLTQPDSILFFFTTSVFTNGYNISCNGNNDGSISTSFLGGVAPFTIIWTGPNSFSSTSFDINNLIAGQYCATLIDGNGCNIDSCLVLTEPNAIDISLFSPVDAGGFNVSCNGNADGSIQTALSGGTAPYTINWTGPNGFTSNQLNLDSLNAETYCITVTDNNNCSKESCITLTAPLIFDLELEPSVYLGGNNIDCNGNTSGFIDATIVGGNNPFNFNWTGPNGFTSITKDIDSLSAGEYCLTAQDFNGCLQVKCVTLIQPQIITTNPVTINPILCFGVDSATVALNISGGTAPYQIIWSNGDSTETVGNLAAGNYIVSVSDANNCVATTSLEVVSPTQITASLFSPILSGGFNITCFGDSTGSIQATIGGGTAPYIINWTGAGIDSLQASLANIQNLTAGEYCITVTDSNNCSIQECIVITQPANPFEASITTDGFINCDGTGTVNLLANSTGGTEPITYTWSGNGLSANTQSVENIAVGLYCVSLVDVNGCTASACESVENQPNYTVTFLVDSIDCSPSDVGSIETSIAGGVAPFNFNWTGPNGFTSTDQNIFNLTDGGSYCLSTSDSTGCASLTCITLNAPEPFDLNIQLSNYPGGFNVSCNSICDGSAEVDAIGGNQPFTFEWVLGVDTISSEILVTNLCAGELLLIAKDNIGCFQIDTVTITEPAPIVVELSSPEFGGGYNVSCVGAATGTIFSNISGGNSFYLYNWSGPGIIDSSLQTQELMIAGLYTLVVTDTNGCTGSGQIILTEPTVIFTGIITPSVFPSGDNISCFGVCDGTLSFTPIAGIEPLLYNWSYLGEANSEEPSLDSLCAGEYQLVVVDANECTYTGILNMTEPEAFVSTIEITNQIVCNGDGDGEVSVNITGGSPDFTFNWLPSQIDSNVVSNLSGGLLTYTALDINGCETGGSIELIEPDSINANGVVTDAICNSATGEIDVTLTGGAGSLAFQWDFATVEEDLVGVLPGDYSITITDAAGCQETFTYIVNETGNLLVDTLISNNLCFGDTTGSIDLTALNAVQPVTYSWSYFGNTIGSTADIQNLIAGLYSVTITDSIGCTYTNEFEVTEPDSLYIQDIFSPVFSNGFNISLYGAQDGLIEALEVVGGTQPYVGTWDGVNGYTNSTIDAFGDLAAGIYTVIVVDKNGCKDSKSIELLAPFELDLPNGISINGDGFNDYLDVHGLESYPDNKLTIFNRWGNIVYEQDDYKNTDRWAGVSNNDQILPDGTYFVVVNVFAIKRDLTGYLEIRK